MLRKRQSLVIARGERGLTLDCERKARMKTINPLQLEALYRTGAPIELIDFRSNSEFRRVHALGARCIPMREFEAAAVLRTRHLLPKEPLYIICRNGVMAELAAKELCAAGCHEAVIVEGGMDDWESFGLPVVRNESAGAVSRIALIAVLTFATAAALLAREFLIAIPLFIALIVFALDSIEAHRRYHEPCHVGLD